MVDLWCFSRVVGQVSMVSGERPFMGGCLLFVLGF